MMRMLSNKKNVKIMSVAISAVFILGVAGLAYMQMNTTAMAAPRSNIAVVDLAKAVPQDSVIMQTAGKEMQEYAKKMQTEFEKESIGMNAAQKQALFMKFQQKMQAKQMEVQKSVENQVQAAIKAVADGKGMEIVMNKEAVLYGGTDITDVVAKKIASEKTPVAEQSKKAPVAEQDKKTDKK